MTIYKGTTKLSGGGGGSVDMTEVEALVSNKVDKVDGKGLSTNDYTTAEKTKLSGLNNVVVTNNLTSTSTTNALSANQGKVLNDKFAVFQQGMLKNTNVIIDGTDPSATAQQTWANVLIGNNIRAFKNSSNYEVGGNIFVGGNIGPNTVNQNDRLNVVIGTNSFVYGNGYGNTYIGGSAFDMQGNNNVAIGDNALCTSLYVSQTVSGNNNVAIGNMAGHFNSGNWTIEDCTMLGAGAVVTATKQVQLGKSGVTVYGASAYNVRSDRRDKTDIGNLNYDYVNFIKNITPRNYRMDQREDYEDVVCLEKQQFDSLSENEKLEYTFNGKNYIKLIKHPKDGSRKRTRLHNGFIAQEVKEVADSLGFDFAGFQDHSVSGGADVCTLAYEEFISPMVATMQHLLNKVEILEQKCNYLEREIVLSKGSE